MGDGTLTDGINFSRPETVKTSVTYCYFIAAFLASLLAPLVSLGIAADFSGPVVSVLDGDTIEVLHDQHPERCQQSCETPPSVII